MTDEHKKDPLDDENQPSGSDAENTDPLEFLNREDDPNVDIDEQDDFETTPMMDAADEDDLDDLEVELVEEVIPPTPEPEPEEEIQMTEQPESTPDTPPEPAPAAKENMAKPRTNMSGGGSGKGPPWIMIGAGVLIVVVALFIFWPRNSSSPSDEGQAGEQSSVVTLNNDSLGVAGIPVPRSSDVDLDDELTNIVPEHADKPPEETRAELRQQLDRNTERAELAEPEVAVTSGTAPITQPQPATQAEPPVATQGPSSGGQWVIQLGSFGTRSNADKLAAKLRAKGFRMEVHDLPTNSGTSYKVWVGFFPTRSAATAYGRLHRDDLGSKTFITHR